MTLNHADHNHLSDECVYVYLLLVLLYDVHLTMSDEDKNVALLNLVGWELSVQCADNFDQTFAFGMCMPYSLSNCLKSLVQSYL